MRLGLLLLIGVPGSGKTTFAKTLKGNFKRNLENEYFFIHVCYDDLINFKSQSLEYELKLARNSVSVKIENLVMAIKEKNYELCPVEFKDEIECLKSFDCDVVLILDDNMYFKSMRYSLYQIAKKCSISFCQMFFNCSLETALNKNSFRNSQEVIPQNTIEKMWSKLEPPNHKNYWERFSVKVDAFTDKNLLIEAVFPVLNDSLKNHEVINNDSQEQFALSRLQCKTNILHQTDVALRDIVGVKMKEFLNVSSEKNVKKFSIKLATRKGEILSDIKAGNICLPETVIEEIRKNKRDKYQLKKFLNEYF